MTTSNINTTANNPNPDNINSQSSTKPKSRTDLNADANNAPKSQDYTADAVFNNDKLSAQQMEGLTDTDELTKQLDGNKANDSSQVNSDIDKNPENALNEEGAERKNAAQLNDGSSGNQSIRNAVDHLNEDKLEDNLLNQDKNANQEKAADNPTPFSPE